MVYQKINPIKEREKEKKRKRKEKEKILINNVFFIIIEMLVKNISIKQYVCFCKFLIFFIHHIIIIHYFYNLHQCLYNTPSV